MAILILRPNAVGDEENIGQATAGVGKHWQDVDEATADGDTTYVANPGAIAWQRDLYALPNHTTETEAINFIKIYVRCYELDGVGYAKPSLKSDSTVTDGTQITLTTSWTTYSQQWATNPADSAAWAWADIDALQIGVSLYGAADVYSYCTQVYVEVDYTTTRKSWAFRKSNTPRAKASFYPDLKMD